MKIDSIQVRVGMILDHEGKLCRVTKIAHITPGRRMAVVHIDMKDIKTGTKIPARFNSGVMLERATLDEKPMQFLFADGDNLTFMDSTNYEQTTLNAELLGESLPWLQENMNVTVEFHGDTPVTIALPQKVTLEVAETDAVVKGQTATGSYKPAKLTNGATVQVPPYIGVGDKVIVNTDDSSFSARA